MKKSLLALAVLGAFTASAQAQTNVTVGGVIQANYKNYKVSNTTRVTQNEARIDDDYTSRFWLTGTEDLGGGNAALFYIENRFNTDVSSAIGDGNGLSNGNTFVGLKGAWGQATLGKHTMIAGDGVAVEIGANGAPALPSSSLAVNTILNYVANQAINNTRVQNSVLYKTPNFSGFSGSLGYSTAASGNEGTVTGASDYAKGQAWYLQGNYSNGPIYANLAYWDNKIEGRPTTITAANADQSQIRLSAAYQFSFGLKAGLQYDHAELKGVGRVAGVGGVDRKRNAWEIPVSYTFGPNTVLASYTKANALSDLANTGAKLYVLGYDFAFSKRTNVGVSYSKLKNDNNGIAASAVAYNPWKAGTSQNGSTLLTGESATIFALGIKHIF